jgi:hypothetical protein
MGPFITSGALERLLSRNIIPNDTRQAGHRDFPRYTQAHAIAYLFYITFIMRKSCRNAALQIAGARRAPPRIIDPS